MKIVEGYLYNGSWIDVPSDFEADDGNSECLTNSAVELYKHPILSAGLPRFSC